MVLERLAARRVCTDCGANYSVDQPPKYGWMCDNCGGEVVQRADDTAEAIQKRLDLYERETAPLIAFYSDLKLLVEVDGLGPPDEVTARLIAAIDERRCEARRCGARPTIWPRCAGPAGSWPRCTSASAPPLRPGTTTAALDRIGRDVIERRGARSNFLGYRGPSRA